MRSDSRTSVALEQALAAEIKAFATAHGTTVTGVVETVLRVFLDSDVAGSNELSFPAPAKRGRPVGWRKPALVEAVPEPLPVEVAADVDVEDDGVIADAGDSFEALDDGTCDAIVDAYLASGSY